MKADLEERTLQADATAPVIKQVLCLISTECFLWSSLSTAVGGSDQSNRRCALFVLTAAEQSPSIVNKPLFLNLALNRNFKLFCIKSKVFPHVHRRHSHCPAYALTRPAPITSNWTALLTGQHTTDMQTTLRLGLLLQRVYNQTCCFNVLKNASSRNGFIRWKLRPSFIKTMAVQILGQSHLIWNENPFILYI